MHAIDFNNVAFKCALNMDYKFMPIFNFKAYKIKPSLKTKLIVSILPSVMVYISIS